MLTQFKRKLWDSIVGHRDETMSPVNSHLSINGYRANIDRESDCLLKVIDITNDP